MLPLLQLLIWYNVHMIQETTEYTVEIQKNWVMNLEELWQRLFAF